MLPYRAEGFPPAFKFEKVENIHKNLDTLRVVKPHLDLACSGLHGFPEKGKATQHKARDGAVTRIVEQSLPDIQLRRQMTTRNPEQQT